ncbi:ABC transporter permease [Anaeromassilibacillus sp. An200]|uniref:ABC transporter permease n=1 Tax=Anaeromassilibacillus sp. An200 TaxID=1965587 RepID=UPI000B382C3B|nr:ABC transporter permease subunit [Anaeromassilibacillus sp. An200]OUP13163.1 sugar ABC transporter permease [Anaeromassilibacillus sp. An200]
MKAAAVTVKRPLSERIVRQVRKNWMLYLFVAPSLIYLIIFNYVPLYGIQLAFKDFSAAQGIWGSKWTGFTHFQRFFESYQFWTLMENTIVLSLYSLCMNFPIPIILALLLNYSISRKFKKFTQTVTYAPYFISVVVLVGMIQVFFAPDGPINQFLKLFGMQEPVLFMGSPEYFRHIFVWSGVWRQAGWGSIIYIATLAGVNPELHEAAIVDGANKLQRILKIDLPSILPTAVIMLIMNVGNIMGLGFEKAYLLQNDINIGVSEIISTYVYKVGIQSAQYSYSTAIGLFNNVINFVLLVTVNRVAKRLSGSSLW